jgi:hypothetical protein
MPDPPAPVVPVVVPLPVLVPLPDVTLVPATSPPPAPVVEGAVFVGPAVPSASEHALAMAKSEDKEIANPHWLRFECSMQPSMRIFPRMTKEQGVRS